MPGIMIAATNSAKSTELATLLTNCGFPVTVPSNAGHAVNGILKDDVQVVVLGNGFDGLPATALVPVLKCCKRALSIILLADELPLPHIRRLRQEGIFYHALPPDSEDDHREICQVVKCACAAFSKTMRACESTNQGGWS